MNNSQKLMLVDLSISIFGGRKYDKKISQEVAVSHNTDMNAGRYNKNLFPTNPASYKAIVTQMVTARAKHNSLTLPWDDAGCRVLASKAYWDYTNAMRDEQQKFESAVNTFLPEYPSIVTESLKILNGISSIDDYPSATDISQYFNIRVKFLPFPSAEDIRVAGLPPSEIDAIKANIEATTKDTLQKALLDPLRRLHGCISRIAETLSTPDAIFRNSLTENLEALRALLPALNITDDPSIETLFALTDSLVANEPDTLRHSPKIRQTVAEKALSLKQQLEGYLLK